MHFQYNHCNFVSIVSQSTLASFAIVEQCRELCEMGQRHIDECCGAYGFRQNGYCSRFVGKQVKCENREVIYLNRGRVNWFKQTNKVNWLGNLIFNDSNHFYDIKRHYSLTLQILSFTVRPIDFLSYSFQIKFCWTSEVLDFYIDEFYWRSLHTRDLFPHTALG